MTIDRDPQDQLEAPSIPRRQSPGKWIWIDNAVLTELPRIGTTAFAVYAILARHADNKSQTCHPSAETIAEALGTSPKTVQRAIKTLAVHSLVECQTSRDRGRWDGIRFTLVDQRRNDISNSVDPNRRTNMSTGTKHRRTNMSTGEAQPVDTGVRTSGQICPSPVDTGVPTGGHICPPPVDIGVHTQELLFGEELTEEELTEEELKRESADATVDPQLLTLVEKLNSLPDGILPSRIRTSPLAHKLVTRYRTAMKTPELREALSDPDRIVAALKTATFAHGQSWASLLGLLSTNRSGEYKLIVLLNGGYKDRGRTNASKSGSGQVFAPGTERKGGKATI